MADIHGGQIAARQLAAAGIDTIFGVVAGPMIEVFAGAQESGLHVVGGRHEMNMGFAASAWGYQKRKAGVLVVGSGPGMTNAVTPMHVATESAMPLVVLGGSAFASTRGVGGFQEADQMAFARPACKWIGQVDSTERIAEWVHLALGKAVEGRPGAVYLDFPGQLVAGTIPEEQLALRSRTPEITRPHPDPNSIDKLADLVAEAERPLVLIGKGAGWSEAGAALQSLVGRGIPYVASPMARGILPDDHPNFANAARSAALQGADLVVMFGGRFNWIFGMGRRFAKETTLVQVDIQAEEMISGAELDLGIVADARASAVALHDALASRKLRSLNNGWLKGLQEQSERNEGSARAALEDDSVPINPYRLVAEVKQAVPRNTTLVAEGETIMGICRAMLPSFGERTRFNAGTTGCMGTGAPYALGAKLAHPERPCVAVLGDYAFGAAAMVVETAARNGVAPIFVVANNEGIAGHMIQDHMLPPGSPKIASLLPAHYEKIGELVDAHSERVDRPDQIRPALDRALAADKVAVVHVRCNPKATRLSGANYLQ